MLHLRGQVPREGTGELISSLRHARFRERTCAVCPGGVSGPGAYSFQVPRR